jgi:hypothetical protein
MSCLCFETARLLLVKHQQDRSRRCYQRLFCKPIGDIETAEDIHRCLLEHRTRYVAGTIINELQREIDVLSTRVLGMRWYRGKRCTRSYSTHVGYLRRHVNVAIHTPVGAPTVLDNNVLLIAGRYTVPNCKNSVIKFLRATIRR